MKLNYLNLSKSWFEKKREQSHNFKFKILNSGFTLLELIIVLGIVGVLSMVVVTVIKPAEILKQSRDNRRLTDLKSVESAIILKIFNDANAFYGTSSRVYVSVPDSSSNCSNLSLPSLPEGWTYACSTESNYRNIDGTGWLPVDFRGTAATFSSLPVDPLNNNSTRRYYSYAANNSYFHIYTPLESEKYSPLTEKDGGSCPDKYERGNSLSILPCVSHSASSQATGTIDSTYKYAWGENIGWVDFGTAEGNVQVSNTQLTGYAWNENAGWISLNCSNTDSCATVDYKVSNDGSGNLSGYAWAENAGWINFGLFTGSTIINGSTGDFSGYAWGENTGWISFNCSNTNSCGTVDYKVKTSWRP